MRDEYDFTDAKPGRFRRGDTIQTTIRLDTETIDYFKSLAEDTGLPYQSLIRLYLNDCAKKKKTVEFHSAIKTSL